MGSGGVCVNGGEGVGQIVGWVFILISNYFQFLIYDTGLYPYFFQNIEKIKIYSQLLMSAVTGSLLRYSNLMFLKRNKKKFDYTL